MIDTSEIKNVSMIKGRYCSIEDKDFDYLKKAVNCEKMDISDNKALTDLSFISSFPKLKEINLENDEKITDFKDLITHKEQFDSIILPYYIIFYNVIVGSTVKTTAKPRAASRKRRRRRDEESIETAVTRKRIITGSATHVARLNSPADRAAGGFAENQKRQKF